MKARFVAIAVSAGMLSVLLGTALTGGAVAFPPSTNAVLEAGIDPQGAVSGVFHQTSARRHVVVSYRQEGGIGGPRPSLLVSRGLRATVTLGRCTAEFALQSGAWHRLRAALREADMHAIAGDYPPPKGAADEITYVIKASRNTVRIAPAPQPEYEEVMRHLRPLLKVLDKTVSIGERRMPPSCKSNRKAR